jgi:hypothetical protein
MLITCELCYFYENNESRIHMFMGFKAQRIQKRGGFKSSTTLFRVGLILSAGPVGGHTQTHTHKNS